MIFTFTYGKLYMEHITKNIYFEIFHPWDSGFVKKQKMVGEENTNSKLNN